MSEDKPATSVWRRRERSLAIGVILWASVVGTAMAVWPQQAASWLTQTPSVVVAGAIMVSVGLLAGVCDAAVVVVTNRLEPNDTADLTEVPWDE